MARKYKSYTDIAAGNKYHGKYIEYSHRLLFIRKNNLWAANLIYVTQDDTYDELFYVIYPKINGKEFSTLEDAITETVNHFIETKVFEFRRDKIRMNHEDV